MGLFNLFGSKDKKQQSFANIMETSGTLRQQGRDEEYFRLLYDHEKIAEKNKIYAPILKELAICYKEGIGTRCNFHKAFYRMNSYSLKTGDNSVEVLWFKADCSLAQSKVLEEAKRGHLAPEEIIEEVAEFMELLPGDQDKKIQQWQKDAAYYSKRANEADAESGDPDAIMRLAKLPENQGPTLFMKYHMMAAENGYYNAAATLFWRFIQDYHQNLPPDSFDINKVAAKLQEGADAGNPDCMFALAVCYARNFVGTFGVSASRNYPVNSPYKPNPVKFMEYLKKAYDSGCTHPGVRLLMAEYYATGKIWCGYHFDQEPVYRAAKPEIDQYKAFSLLKPVFLDLRENLDRYEHKYPEKYYHYTYTWFQLARFMITICYFDGYGVAADIDHTLESFPYASRMEDGEGISVTSGDHAILTAMREELKKGQMLRLGTTNATANLFVRPDKKKE